ncbi:MAG: transposase, partial [Tissierellia bacterium]|nr:transposase [Tissierellia bacterium]
IKNSFRTSLSNGVLEGINNKIKLIKRIAYGYRSFVNLRLRIMLCFTLTKKVGHPT